MSYILDALKKSEQARGLRKTLGLLEAPVSSPSLKSVARWPYLVAFVLVLNAGFLVYWLRPWQWGGNVGSSRNSSSGVQSPEAGRQADLAGPPALPVRTDDRLDTSENRPEEKEKSALNPPATHGAQAVSSVAGREKEGEQGKTESTDQAADAAGGAKTVASAAPGQETARDHVGENKAHGGDQGVKQAKRTEQPPGSSGTTEPAKKTDGSKPHQDSKTAGSKQGTKIAKSQATGKKPASSAEPSLQSRSGSGVISDLRDFTKLEPSSGKPAAPPAPRWHELAPEVRDAIPSIIVSMLIYSKNPEERWININGSKRREGQEISSGLRLEQITPDGAIFSYRGQRFFKGIVGD